MYEGKFYNYPDSTSFRITLKPDIYFMRELLPEEEEIVATISLNWIFRYVDDCCIMDHGLLIGSLVLLTN